MFINRKYTYQESVADISATSSQEWNGLRSAENSQLTVTQNNTLKKGRKYSPFTSLKKSSFLATIEESGFEAPKENGEPEQANDDCVLAPSVNEYRKKSFVDPLPEIEVPSPTEDANPLFLPLQEIELSPSAEQNPLFLPLTELTLRIPELSGEIEPGERKHLDNEIKPRI